jgi:hypothetical protein
MKHNNESILKPGTEELLRASSARGQTQGNLRHNGICADVASDVGRTSSWVVRTSRVDLARRCVEDDLTPVHAACRVAVYPGYCPGSPVTSGNGRGMCARLPLSYRAELTRLMYPSVLRLKLCDHRYEGVRWNYKCLFHAVSVKKKGKSDRRTYQRIESRLDRGTSALRRLTL